MGEAMIVLHLTEEQFDAMLDAVEQVDGEYGFNIGEGSSLGNYRALHPQGNLGDYYAAARIAMDAGADFIAMLHRVRDAHG